MQIKRFRTLGMSAHSGQRQYEVLQVAESRVVNQVAVDQLMHHHRLMPLRVHRAVDSDEGTTADVVPTMVDPAQLGVKLRLHRAPPRRARDG
ncbi:hypothetical protein [Micromonospora sp. MA102]|uniref:hypothetical protein n=1 Tax=Micromonospora sp. MA102 TaxID=2952755 RepID=UPI0021C89847|nr:hypothetical protein [Micromonospora sp. MA102]